MSATRIRGIVRKDLSEYRRNRSIVVTMAILPLIFAIQPLVQVFTLAASEVTTLAGKEPLLYLLGIPVLVPAALAATTIVGERQLGTLEPVLTTPISREELLLAKALAVLVPALAISYAVYGIAVGAIEAFADPAIASAVVRAPALLAQLVFTPLLAAWSIWVGIAVSTRCSDVRTAQQLSILASLPPVVLAALIAVGVIHTTSATALALGVALLLLDLRGWRIVAPMLDRERLVTGSRS